MVPQLIRIPEDFLSGLALVLETNVYLSENNADIIVKATCALHNFLTENIPIRAIENQLNPNQEPYLGRD